MTWMAQKWLYELYDADVRNGIYGFTEQGFLLLRGSHCFSKNKLSRENSGFQYISKKPS